MFIAQDGLLVGISLCIRLKYFLSRVLQYKNGRKDKGCGGKIFVWTIHDSPIHTQKHLYHIMKDRLHIVVFFDFIQQFLHFLRLVFG